MACNLTPNPTRPRKFNGAIGNSVSISVRGTAGTAQFTGGTYAGAAIPINPATFVIQAGDQLLDLVVENTLSEDNTQIVCDADGSVLDEYPYDRNNPTRLYDILGA